MGSDPELSLRYGGAAAFAREDLISGPLAILSSMDQELSGVRSRLDSPATHLRHGQTFITGMIGEVPVVTAITGYGKVASAAATASVLHLFDAAAVIFGGVAGGIHQDVAIGDVVVADRLIQHDFDASPLFPPGVIPSLGVDEIPANPGLTDGLVQAAETFLATGAPNELAQPPTLRFTPGAMKLHRGLIASGDRFIGNPLDAKRLATRLPALLAVEMEGAAVAQVCAERHVPFGVFRLVSDRSDNDAEVDFLSFIASVAAPLTAGIVEQFAKHFDG